MSKLRSSAPSPSVPPRQQGQTTTEYILILFLSVSLFTFTAKTLGPILRKVAKAQSERLEKQFGEGLYRFRLPGRG